MYINLNNKFLKENEKEMRDDAIANLGKEDQEVKDILYSADTIDEIGKIELEEVDGSLVLNIDVTNEVGYFGVVVQLNDDTAFEIIEHMKEKGEKIKRLIQLTDKK